MSASFNFDVSALLESAASIFNSFAPIFLVIGGIGVGIALLLKVVSEVRKAL